MKHPPSKTIGRKYWLAKAMKFHDMYFSKGEYGFSPANFNPENLTIKQARLAGRDNRLWRPWGALLGAQIWRMAYEANIGDVIFLESGNKNIHAWGVITGTYKFRSPVKITKEYLDRNEIHNLSVKWHEVKNGNKTFRSGRGDNLCFREITDKKDVLKNILKFIDSPLPEVEKENVTQMTATDVEYLEGGKVLRSHLATERSSKAAGLAKELARKKSKSGKLTCEACKCTPEDDYKNTQTAIDIIEAHHRIPLAKGERNTKPEDFCMLCPCCHRAVHKLINTDINPQLALQIIVKCNI